METVTSWNWCADLLMTQYFTIFGIGKSRDKYEVVRHVRFVVRACRPLQLTVLYRSLMGKFVLNLGVCNIVD